MCVRLTYFCCPPVNLTACVTLKRLNWMGMSTASFYLHSIFSATNTVAAAYSVVTGSRVSNNLLPDLRQPDLSCSILKQSLKAYNTCIVPQATYCSCSSAVHVTDRMGIQPIGQGCAHGLTYDQPAICSCQWSPPCNPCNYMDYYLFTHPTGMEG